MTFMGVHEGNKKLYFFIWQTQTCVRPPPLAKIVITSKLEFNWTYVSNELIVLQTGRSIVINALKQEFHHHSGEDEHRNFY